MTQLTGILGQAGQVLSAFPLVALLRGPGWTTAFLAAASLGVLLAVLVAVLVRDAPAGRARRHDAPTMAKVARDLRSAWRHPGTRLGLWTHATQFSGMVFALLWGYPYLVTGEGRTPRTASTLLTVFVLTGMVAGPFFGVGVARHPLRRSWLVLAVIGATVVAWTAVLLWPGRSPLWLLVALVLALALGGPGSLIAFDFARTFNPPNRLGTATGIVNIGGFVASLLVMLGVGLVLDLRSPGSSAYSLGDFRLALATQYVVWAVGIAGIVRTRRRVRARMAREGVVVPPIREVIARRRRAGG
jgi:predicted MFS family arabinose efflux permease